MSSVKYIYEVKDSDHERHYEMLVDLSTGQILEEHGDRMAYFAAKQLEKYVHDVFEEFNRTWQKLIEPFDRIFGSFQNYSLGNHANIKPRNSIMQPYFSNEDSEVFSEPEHVFSEPEFSFAPTRPAKMRRKFSNDNYRNFIDNVSKSSFRYDKPEFRERVWEFNGKKFRLVDEVDNHRIVEAKGNPEISELAEKFGKYDEYYY
jgi:hypothetical protein